MAQSNIVKAFRKRLRKREYEEITIRYDSTDGHYFISAVEPLSGERVRTKRTELEMYHMMR